MISKNYFRFIWCCALSCIICAGCFFHHQPVVTTVVENDTVISVKIKYPKRYLIIPVEDSAVAAPVYLDVDGHRQFLASIRFAQTKTNYFVPLRLPDDFSEVTLLVVTRSKNPIFTSQLSSSDEFIPTMARDARPLYHYTSSFGWMGSPAGAVFDGNRYHLYYESNPNGFYAENEQWGHAESTDLFDWTDCGTAFTGDSIGMALGGTCLLDKFNTFGAGNTAQIALYTATRGTGDARRQEQCIAFSKDGGDHFEKFVTNPVLRTYDDIPDFRHPGIFRYRRANIWEMVISCGDQMRIYSAEDLGNWNLESYLGKEWGSSQRLYDGAQMVQLKAPDGADKWVLLCTVSDAASASYPFVEYHIGSFDGKTFTPDANGAGVLDCGTDFSGPMPVDNAEDRCVVFGWLNSSLYAEALAHKGFSGQIALPRELALVNDGLQLRVVMRPAKETERLRGNESDLGQFKIKGRQDFSGHMPQADGAFEVAFTSAGDVRGLNLKLYNTKGETVTLTVDQADRLHLSRPSFKEAGSNVVHTAAAPMPKAESHQFRIFVDRSSIEVFVDNGRLVMSQLLVLSSPLSGLSFENQGAPLTIRSLKLWPLAIKTE